MLTTKNVYKQENVFSTKKMPIILRGVFPMFVIKHKIEDLKNLLQDMEEERDFEYRDIIKMDDNGRAAKTEMIKKKNLVKEEIKMLERFNFRQIPFDRDRFYRYKIYDCEELCMKAVEAKYAGETAGGKEYMKNIKLFEEMRDEIFWRAQKNIDVINGIRSDANIADMLSIERENNLQETVEFFKSCTKIEPEYAGMLLEIPDRMRALSVRVKGEIVSACVYDVDYKLYYVATSGDYANMKLGKRMFERVKSLANAKDEHLKALAPADDKFITNFEYMDSMDIKEFGKVLYCQNDDFLRG